MRSLVILIASLVISTGAYAQEVGASNNLGAATAIASQAEGTAVAMHTARMTMLIAAATTAVMLAAIGAVDKDDEPVTPTPPPPPPPPPPAHTPASH